MTISDVATDIHTDVRPTNGSAPVADGSANARASAVLPVRSSRWWVLSMLSTALLALVLMILWATWPDDRESTELANLEDFETELDRIYALNQPGSEANRLRTGLWIQSLRFVDPQAVQITGYVWQRFDGDRVAELGDPESPYPTITLDQGPVTVGIVFPDQIGGETELQPRYVVFDPDGTQLTLDEVGRPLKGTTQIGWYFDSTIHQERVQYGHYPFDDQTIKVAIWQRDFVGNGVIVPDYEGYPCPDMPTENCTGQKDTFGIDTEILVVDYEQPENTFFFVEPEVYNSTFGLKRADGFVFPTTSFNIDIDRRVGNALVGNLVPLVVIVGLAFALLMTITVDVDRARLFNFNTTEVVGALVALFIATLVAHLQLRAGFAGVVYLEWLFFVTYLVVLGVAVIALLAAAPQTRGWKVFRIGDNLIPQILYWPTLMGALILVTLPYRF